MQQSVFFYSIEILPETLLQIPKAPPEQAVGSAWGGRHSNLHYHQRSSRQRKQGLTKSWDYQASQPSCLWFQAQMSLCCFHRSRKEKQFLPHLVQKRTPVPVFAGLLHWRPELILIFPDYSHYRSFRNSPSCRRESQKQLSGQFGRLPVLANFSAHSKTHQPASLARGLRFLEALRTLRQLPVRFLPG